MTRNVAMEMSIIQSGLQQICDEMDIVQVRSSFSPVITEALDRSNGIYQAETGAVIAQGEWGLPSFMGVMQATTKAVIESRREYRDGDIFIINDPYLGGTHLQDVKLVKPFFYRNRLWCWLSNTGHWPDVGGTVPGGFFAEATEIQQEGLRIPPIKFVKGGQIDEELMEFILYNVRVPEERVGDIRAQVGALNVGAERLARFLDKHGANHVTDIIKLLADRSEQQMRSNISTIADGVYTSTVYTDNDGISHKPLEIHTRIVKAGSTVRVSFEGTSPPAAGPLNSPWACTETAVFVAFKHIFPDVPVNHGCFRPIEIERPVGTYLDARYPSPCNGAAAEISQRVIEAIFAALGAALPSGKFACPAGTTGNLTVGGIDPRNKRPYVFYMITGGGYGGWWGGDGISFGCSSNGISKSQPVEVIERRYPLVFEEYSLAAGSGGAGKHRGGFGLKYRFRVEAEAASIAFMMDHGVFGPPGLDGGEQGSLNRILMSINGDQRHPEFVSKGNGYVFRRGDWIEVQTPGGGGFGDPREREDALVERDLRRQYYTQAQMSERFQRDTMIGEKEVPNATA